MSGVTAKFIAERLGISAAAVSMALNGKPGVSEKTRRLVDEEALKLGYKVPREKRADSLAAKSISFAVYVGAGIAEQTTFSAFVLKGIESQAKSLGYRVLVHYLYENAPFEEQWAEIQNGTSGVIMLGTDITETRRDMIGGLLSSATSTPLVVVDNFLFAAYVDCVGNDNMFASKSAVSYLIKNGHRSIGYLRSRQRITNFEDREVGVRLAMNEHRALGLSPLQAVDVDISPERAYYDLCLWLGQGNEPAGAYFAENDMLAMAAIRAFTEYGRSVPEEVSVIGFDDLPICEMTQPKLTTMHSFKERLGEVSVTRLHQRILDGDTAATASRTGVMKIAMSLSVKERESVRAVRDAV